MPTLSVADLRPKGHDAMGFEIIIIYGLKAPEYAVYRTVDRVLVQFADAHEKACEQRKALAPLNPLRGEINGLIDGWRSDPKRCRKAERYDRRVGDALVVAFEGDECGAQLLLKEVKQNILDERVALARFQYLGTAFLTGVLGMLFVGFMMRFGGPDPDVMDLFRAAATGAVGAFFSISLAIRGRTVLPDLQRVSNMMDAVLRMVIGVIGGAVLMAFVTAGVVNVSLGRGLSPTSAKHWLFVLIVGFIAGFSERFVPDLLAKAAPSTEAPVIPKPAEVVERQADAARTDGEKRAAIGQPSKDEESLSEDAAADICAVGIDVPDDQVTSDAELPAASGGVAKPEAA
jgi:hypothetical protein